MSTLDLTSARSRSRHRREVDSATSLSTTGGQAAPTEDVYIAVMGVTGTGKSSFISTCTGKVVNVGHGLESSESLFFDPTALCNSNQFQATRDVQDVSFMYNSSLRVHLIDTPGFGDSYLSDTEVLRILASWLSQSFKNGIRLSGIIYMHRISDGRFRGSEMKNLTMFKKLCGESAYPSVALTTSMWDIVSEEVGIKREQMLQDEPDFWGSMIMKGSRVFRYLDTRQSALEVVGYLVSRHSSVVLDIQDELVHKLYDFHETSAAKQLDGDLVADRKRYEIEYKELEEQTQEAIAEGDKTFQSALDEEAECIRRVDTERMMLNQPLETLEKQKAAEFRELGDRQPEELQRYENEFEIKQRPREKEKREMEENMGTFECQKAKQETQEEVGRRNSGKFTSCFCCCDLAIWL